MLYCAVSDVEIAVDGHEQWHKNTLDIKINFYGG